MKAGTISRAAELLGVTQPGVSRAIAELEKSLGFLLFDRIRNRIIATPEGKLFYAQVQASFLGMDTLRATAARIRDHGAGQLRVGSLSALANRNFYERAVTNRVAIVFTDAESRPFSSASIGRIFRRPPGIHVVFVRYGNTGERVFTLAGGAERGYTPDPNAPATARILAQATGGAVYEEGSTEGVVNTVRKMIGSGDTSVDSDDRPFPVGSAVTHPEWGRGTVQTYEEGDRVVVLFDAAGYKTLSLDVVEGHHLLTRA